MVVVLPVQTAVAPAVVFTVGNAFTVIVLEAVDEQPFTSVPVTV